jgi:hypothetical protein
MKPASVGGASLDGIDTDANDRDADDSSAAAGPHPPTVFPPGRADLSTRPGSRAALLVVGLVVLLAVPLSVALGVLHQPRWYPIADLAQTELRVRDVGSAHSPLIGLPGRLGSFGSQGSHPGPLSFWSMAPVYRVFGASSWGMQAAAVFLHVVAMATILAIAHRRGGVRLTLGMAAMLAVLIRVYGTATLTEAWNPYVPVLWWVVFLLAVWSVLSRDLKMLPVAVFAASFCMQTHLPYVGLAGVLFAVAFAVVSFQTWQRRAEPGAVRHFARWALLAAGVGLLVWLPPVIDQLTSEQGNLSIVWKELTNPPETAVGVRRGLELLLVHLNPWRLLARQPTATTGALLPGVLLLCAWAASVVVSWRLRHRSLLHLHLVLAGALVLAALSMTRIHGIVWYYLVLWAWGVNALIVLAIGWTVSTVALRRASGERREALARAGTLALAGIIVGSTALFTVDATRAEVPDPVRSRVVGELAGPTVRALPQGHAGRYLVTWSDPISIGSQGYGLFDELDRRGFRVGVPEIHRSGATRHRVVAPGEATAEVHLAVGPEIDKWRAKPGVRRVAYVDVRTAAQRAEYQRLRGEVFRELQAAHRADAIDHVDSSLFTSIFDTSLPRRARALMERMFAIGLPAAVFVGPVSVTT